jgi:putative transposase
LLGEEGLLKELKKRLLERALGAELSEHLGYEKAIRPARQWQQSQRLTNHPKMRMDSVNHWPCSIS